MLGNAADEHEQLRRRRSGIGHEQRRQKHRRSEPGRLRRIAVKQCREDPGSLDRRRARGSIGKDRISEGPRILESANDKLSSEVKRRGLGERLENGQADDRRGVVEDAGAVNGGDRRRVARQHLDRIHADAGRRVLEGAADGVEEGDVGVLRDQPHLEECPEGMDRAGIEAD